MQNITLAFSDGPKAVFAIFAAGVLPDHHRAFENSAPSSKPTPRSRSVLACLASSHSNSIIGNYA